MDESSFHRVQRQKKQNNISRGEGNGLYVWLYGLYIFTIYPLLLKRSVLLKIIRKALRIVATSGRHFNARASPRRGLKAPSKENIRVACHLRMSTRATLALSIGVANIYMPPLLHSPSPLLLGLTALFSACLLKMTDLQKQVEIAIMKCRDRNQICIQFFFFFLCSFQEGMHV